MFNGLLQPFFTLIQNILQSICDMAEPLAKLTDNMLRPFAELVRAFRIVEVKNQTKIHQPESQAPRFSTFQG